MKVGAMVVIASPAGSRWDGRLGRVVRIVHDTVMVRLLDEPSTNRFVVLPFGISEVKVA